MTPIYEFPQVAIKNFYDVICGVVKNLILDNRCPKLSSSKFEKG